jgi:CubicO group peptidase (beta-lactamase class C family)
VSHFRNLLPILVRIPITIGLLLVPLAFAQARPPASFDLPTVDAFLRSQMAASRIPGLAVVIVQDGQVVLLRGYGEAGPGRPVTPQTQFYLGSVTKGFTALAVMQLVEQGKLELDAPVQRYLPWFRVADEGASAAITVRHLLNHTSGLSEPGDPGAAQYAPTLADQVHTMGAARLTAPVGSKYQYYNKNYQALGLLIEQASGQPYGDYMRAHVFEPLGMPHTVADPADAPELAQGYSQAFGFPIAHDQAFRPGGLPSGYIISSAEDMAHYLVAQIDGATYAGRQLVQPATLAQIRTPPAGIGSQYGMGWMVLEDGNTLAHGGDTESFHSIIVMGLKEKTGFVILCNQNSLFQMMTGHQAVIEGMVQLLNGKVPAQPSSLAWAGLALAAVVAVDLLNHLRLFWQLPRWAARATAAGRRRWVGWLQAVLSVAIRAALLVWLPALIGIAIDGSSGAGWPDMAGLLPDVTGWLLLTLGLGLVRGLAKLAIMAHTVYGLQSAQS